MSDLFGNHIVGFPTRRLTMKIWFLSILSVKLKMVLKAYIMLEGSRGMQKLLDRRLSIKSDSIIAYSISFNMLPLKA